MSAPFSRNRNVGGDWDDHDILATKLRIPDRREDLVLRPGLTEQLNQGVQHKLILVSAPAGFGKTTLLSAWHPTLAGEHLPVAWVALDKYDNDPARFWAYVVSALHMLPAGGERTIEPPELAPPRAIGSLISSIINDWAARTQHAVLILDDYHLITESAIHEQLLFLLEHLPPQLHLVLSSRTDPPPPLARLRAEGQLSELRVTQLLFSSAEVAEFVALYSELALSAESTATLEAATEGWIAALRLALIALKAGGHLPGAPVTISGRQRYIFDYLAEEVFQQQSPAVQHFLLNTSILDRLCAPLCDAVTGLHNGGEMLELLERANLFLLPLDTERRWYTYHHLFADFLCARLEDCAAEDAVDLHIRASQWYERSNMAEQAISHALAAEDFPRACRLIASAAEATLQRGEVVSLLNWLSALPAPIVHASAGLCTWFAWVLFLSERLPEAERYVSQAERRLRDAKTGTAGGQTQEDYDPVADIDLALGQIAVIRSFVAQKRGDVRGTLRYSEHARRLIRRADNTTMRALILLNLGAAHKEQGALAQAAQEFEEAERVSTASGEVYNASGATEYLANLYIWQGDLPQAATVYRQALQRFPPGAATPMPAAGMLYVGLGDICYEQNRLDSAHTYIVQGLQACEAGGSVALRLRGQVALARTTLALGEADEAVKLLDKAVEAALQRNPDIAYIRLWQARIQMRLGDRAPALQWVAEHELEQKREMRGAAPTSVSLRELAIGTLVRVSLGDGGGTAYNELLAEALQAAERGGRFGSLLEFLILEALLLQTQGKLSAAVSRLERAIAIAIKGGYIRLFLDEGSPMFELLSAALDMQRRQPRRFSSMEQKQNYHYVGALLAAFRAEKGGAPYTLPGAGQGQQLTRREWEVLRLLAARLPYRAIATALVITEDTTKWHIKNIYRKFQVTDRTHLIERVRDLDLLA